MSRSRRRRSALERRLMRRARAAEAELFEEEPEPPRLALKPPKDGETWVDLLHAQPLVTADIELLRSAVRFGFESGDAGGLLTQAVDEAPTAPSTFGDGSIVSGLFLPELVSELFSIPAGDGKLVPSQANLVRLIGAPPDDHDDVLLRQGVLRELCDRPELQDVLVVSLVTLRELRNLLDDRPMTTGETIARKLEVLATLRKFYESAARFSSCTSALSRLGEFALEVTQSDAFTRLVDLLRFEQNMAELQVRVVLDYEGRIRDYEVLHQELAVANPLVRSAWRRTWERIVGFFRGHRYGEHEIILRIMDDIFEALEDAVVPSFALVGHLEFYAAAMSFRAHAEKSGLKVSLPEFETESIQLEKLFNPILLLMKDVSPVPCDIETESGSCMVLVTGPNSGGKTRMLQSLALTQLFGQAGIFVPAEKSRLVFAPKMFVSLIEGAPVDHKEGRLGTELMRVRQLFEQIEPGCLVILDELCSGTNPSEGIAIFEMVLSLLPRVRPRAFLTTHFLDAARRLHDDQEDTPGALRFLQVELDDAETPTYQFVPGVAPTSLAHAVAARLGVTQGELEALVEKHL